MQYSCNTFRFHLTSALQKRLPSAVVCYYTDRKIIPCVSILETYFQQLGLLSNRIQQKFRQNWLGSYLQTVYFKVPKVGSQIHQNLNHESQQLGVPIMSPNSWEFRSHIRERKTQLGLDSQMLGENSKISEFFEAEHPQSCQC